MDFMQCTWDDGVDNTNVERCIAKPFSEALHNFEHVLC